MKNHKVAEIFAAMADILAIQGESAYRITAYRRAAENVATLGQPLEDIWRAGELETIPGVGKTLAAKIDELMRTGCLEAYEKLGAQVPAGVVEMLQIPDVGPRKAALFWNELGTTSIEALEQAAREGRLRGIKGMGAKSEAKVLAGIGALKRRTGRTLLGVAWPLAYAMLGALQQVPGVVRAAPAGSMRRMRETVGDLDLLVAATDAEPASPEAARRVMACFRGLAPVAEILLSGPTKTSIRTHEGLQVDLRVLEPARWGTALQYFTGSQAHNVHLRALALDRGFSLSEYALKREDGAEILCATEQEVYAALGLPFIPPELREDRGEIEAALEGRLPNLIEPGDLKGDLHFHTTWSDGRHSLLEMARAAQAHGLEYAAVADHSHSLGIVKGVTAADLRRQRAEIEEVNRKMGGTFRLLAGAEVEVLADGTLDFCDEVLAELDLVVAAVHTGLRQGREQFTARTLAAIRNPHVDVIAHPTGRLIGEREGADLDMEAVFRAAAETGTALEINAYFKRLDLCDVHVRRALELGVKLAINSDAHDVNRFATLPFGVATARRGWATAADVINTWNVGRLLEWVAQ
jgi:DNA polymerase (family 10)